MIVEDVVPATSAATATTAATVKHWINGAETEGSTGRSQPIVNPSSGEVSARLTLGDAILEHDARERLSPR